MHAYGSLDLSFVVCARARMPLLFMMKLGIHLVQKTGKVHLQIICHLGKKKLTTLVTIFQACFWTKYYTCLEPLEKACQGEGERKKQQKQSSKE